MGPFPRQYYWKISPYFEDIKGHVVQIRVTAQSLKKGYCKNMISFTDMDLMEFVLDETTGPKNSLRRTKTFIQMMIRLYEL